MSGEPCRRMETGEDLLCRVIIGKETKVVSCEF